MATKRITVSIDEELWAKAATAVEAGRYPSMSSWVAAAVADRCEADARRQALEELTDEFEAAHGEFTDEELERGEVEALQAAAAVRAGTWRPA